MSAQRCPSCNADEERQERLCSWSIYLCKDCYAIHGTCRERESYVFVKAQMIDNEPPEERVRYFDFMCYGRHRNASYRRHGFFDIETRRIVQIG